MPTTTSTFPSSFLLPPFFETAGGQRCSLADVCYHLATILSGLYSLAGQPDAAIVEQRIVRSSGI